MISSLFKSRRAGGASRRRSRNLEFAPELLETRLCPGTLLICPNPPTVEVAPPPPTPTPVPEPDPDPDPVIYPQLPPTDPSLDPPYDPEPPLEPGLPD